jgi:hypothetical protein
MSKKSRSRNGRLPNGATLFSRVKDSGAGGSGKRKWRRHKKKIEGGPGIGRHRGGLFEGIHIHDEVFGMDGWESVISVSGVRLTESSLLLKITSGPNA